MARTPAWDDQLELDALGNSFRRSRSGRWKTVLVSIGLIGAATFVLGYYLPLHRAHAALSEQHRVLSGKAQATAGSLNAVKAELATTKDKRDELERERHQRESARGAELAKLDVLKASVATKLEKFVSKGQAAITASDGRLLVSLPESLLFAPQKAEVTPRGKAVLCDLARTTTQNALRIGAVAGAAGDAAFVLPAEFKSAWAFTAARAASAAQTLEQGCGVAGSRLSATGHGSASPSVVPSDVAQKFPARIDVEIVP